MNLVPSELLLISALSSTFPLMCLNALGWLNDKVLQCGCSTSFSLPSLSKTFHFVEIAVTTIRNIALSSAYLIDVSNYFLLMGLSEML